MSSGSNPYAGKSTAELEALIAEQVRTSLLTRAAGPDGKPDYTKLSREEQETLIRLHGVEKPRSEWGSAFRGLTDSFTWGDEGRSAIGATWDAVTSDKTWWDSYERRQRDEAERSAKAYADNPKSYIAGNLGGGAAMAIAAKRPVGMSGAAEGALWGAALGAGEGEGAERIGNAAFGTVVGGAAGKAGDAVGNYLGRRSAVRDLFRAAEEGKTQAAIRGGAEAGLPLDRAQASGNVADQAFMTNAENGGFGPGAQRAVADHRAAQAGAIGERVDALGEQYAGTAPTIARPGDAAEALRDRVGSYAGREVAALEAQEAQTVQRANELREQGSLMAGRGQVLAENPNEMGDIVGQSLRAREAAARGAKDEAYARLDQQPGSFDPAALDAMDVDIQTQLTSRRNGPPITVDENTPIASSVLNFLQRRGQPEVKRNQADPLPQDPSAPVPMREMERIRSYIASRERIAWDSGNREDYRAVRAMRDAFDDRLERSIEDGLFSGDPAVLDMTREARRLNREWRQRFHPDGPEDWQAHIRKIISRNATPDEIANYVTGLSQVGEKGSSFRLSQYLRETFGADSPEWSAIRQSMWNGLTRAKNADPNAPAITRQNADRIASNIEAFAGEGGRGRLMAAQYFEPQELAAMQAFARNLRAFAAHRATTPDSLKTFLDIGSGQHNPERLVQMFVGSAGKGGRSDANWRLAQAVRDTFGETSDEFQILRQMAWRRLADVPDLKPGPGAQKLANDIIDFIEGPGAGVARILFRNEEIDELRRLAVNLRRMVPKPGAQQPSRTAGHATRLAEGIMGSNALAQAGAAATGAGFGAVTGGDLQDALLSGAAVAGGIKGRHLYGQSKAKALIAGRKPPMRSLAEQARSADALLPPALPRIGGAIAGQSNLFDE